MTAALAVLTSLIRLPVDCLARGKPTVSPRYAAASILADSVDAALDEVGALDGAKRRADRRARFRAMGVFTG